MSEQLCLVRAIPWKLEEVFLNIFINAIDAMPDHTKKNFHLKVLRENGLIEQDEGKSYLLSPTGRQVKECLDFIVKNLSS